MAAKDFSVTVKNEDLERLSLKLGVIDAQVDALAMLTTTGDVTSLKKGVLTASLLDIGERLTEAKRSLDDMHLRAGRNHG